MLACKAGSCQLAPRNELGAVQNSPPHWFGLCDTCRAETRIAAALLAERANKLSKRWLANASTET